MAKIKLWIGINTFHLPIYDVEGDYYALADTWPSDHKGYMFHYRKLKQNWLGIFSYSDTWLSKNTLLTNRVKV